MASFNTPLSGKFLLILATLACIPASLYVGRLAGQGNTNQLGMIFVGMFGVLILLAMGEKSWWAIPISFALDLPPLPIAGRQLEMREVGTIAAFAFFFARILMHRQRVELHRRENVSVFLYFGWVFMVFCMNPVGFSSMGAGSGGGRAYLTLIIALLSFLVVSQQAITEFEAKWIIIFTVIGTFISLGWNILLYNYFSGSLAMKLGAVTQVEGEYTWQQSLAGPAFVLMSYLFSRYRFKTVFSFQHPLLPLIVLFCFVVGMLSGKRAVFTGMLFIPVIAAMIRKDWNVVWIGAIGAPLLLLVIALGHNNLYKLPYAPQRVLSFIPGMRLDSDVKEDTESEFRPALRAIAMDYIKEDPLFGRKGYKVDFDVILDSVYGSAIQETALSYRDQGFIKKIAMTGSWHTTWLGIAADFGIPAAVLFLFFYMQMIGLGLWLLRQDYIKNSIPFRTLVMMITITVIVALARSWTSGHSTEIANKLWWQYGLLIALRYLPVASKDALRTGSKKSGISPGTHLEGQPVAGRAAAQ
jgi:hypothetical protein